MKNHGLDRSLRDRRNEAALVASCVAVFLVIVACAIYFIVKLVT
jgi:hypothetical protein